MNLNDYLVEEAVLEQSCSVGPQGRPALPAKHSLPIRLKWLPGQSLGHEVRVHQLGVNSLNGEFIRVLLEELPEVMVLGVVVPGPGGQPVCVG